MITVVSLGLVALVWFTVLVVLGRFAAPRAERMRLRTWGIAEVWTAAAVGAREVKDMLAVAQRYTAGPRVWC